MEGNIYYPLPMAVEQLNVADNEAAGYPIWSGLAGAHIRQAGEMYTVLVPGRRNTGPGPDFLHARIRFPDGSMRAGDIEIHCRTGGWYQHGHQWDIRYSNVILHVIMGGTAAPVKLSANQLVPTIYLPLRLPEDKPCENKWGTTPDAATTGQLIRLLAAQRWYHRLGRLKTSTANRPQLELALRLTCGSAADQLLQIWLEEFQNNTVMPAFIEQVLGRTQGELGLSRKSAGRLAAGSALVWLHRHAQDKLFTLNFSEVCLLIKQLAVVDLPVPTRQFVIELVGNWLFPLSHLESGKSRYDEWYNLPRGWLYSGVRAFLPKLDWAAPKLFGEQQGLLEWVESLCDSNSCVACPLVNSPN